MFLGNQFCFILRRRNRTLLPQQYEVTTIVLCFVAAFVVLCSPFSISGRCRSLGDISPPELACSSCAVFAMPACNCRRRGYWCAQAWSSAWQAWGFPSTRCTPWLTDRTRGCKFLVVVVRVTACPSCCRCKLHADKSNHDHTEGFLPREN